MGVKVFNRIVSVLHLSIFSTETEQNRQEPRRNGRRFLGYVERHSRSLGGRQAESKVLLFEPKRGTYTSFYRFHSDAKR